MVDKLIVFFFGLFVAFFGAKVSAFVKAPDISPFEVLNRHYLPQFLSDTESDDTVINKRDTAGNENIQYQTQAQPLSPYSIRKNLLHYFLTEKQNGADSIAFFSDVWRDIRVFDIPNKKHLYDAAFPGSSLLGEVFGAYLLATGATDDIYELKRRQRLIKRFSTTQVCPLIKEQIVTIEKYLSEGVALFQRDHPLNKCTDSDIFIDETIFDNEFFSSFMPGLQNVNNEEDRLALRRQWAGINLTGYTAWISRLTEYGSFVAFHAQYLVSFYLTSGLRAASRGVSDSVKSILTGVGFLSGKAIRQFAGYSSLIRAPLGIFPMLKAMIENERSFMLRNKVITEELLKVQPFLETVFVFKNHYYEAVNFRLTQDWNSIINLMFSNIKMLNKDRYYFYHGNLQKAAIALRALQLLKPIIAQYLKKIAMLDFYCSVANEIKESDSWSFAEFENYGTGMGQRIPAITAKKMWNPTLLQAEATPSNIELGREKPASLVITGENGSGKSTFLRSMAINSVFMAQTLGIAAAESFRLRPFNHFDSLLEKRDTKGRSSYEVETDAAVRVISNTRSLGKYYQSLIIADELFRTTNEQDGSRGSKFLVQKIAEQPQVALLVSTHYRSLTNLALEYPGIFANKHMKVTLDETTGEVISMKYVLVDGPAPITTSYRSGFQVMD